MNSNKNFVLLLYGLLTCSYWIDAAENILLNFGKSLDVRVLQIGKTLTDSLITTLTGASLVTCLEECSKRPRCYSINYRRQFLLCELNQETTSYNAVQDTQGSLFSPIQPWIASDSNECSRSSSNGNDLKIKCSFNEFGIVNKSISDCGTPPSIQQVTYDVSNGIGLYSKVTYSCDSGYAGNGRSTISCMSNGTWSDQGFQCLQAPACSRGFEIDGNSCKACEVGTYSPAGIDGCLKCPPDQNQDLSQQDSCMKCTSDDNPCGEPYTLQDTNIVVELNEDRTECRAIYFCRDTSGVSVESKNVLIVCDRDKLDDGSYSFHWTRPSLHCAGVSTFILEGWEQQFDDCGSFRNFALIQTSNVGQILEIENQDGGNFSCDKNYDGDLWTVIQQRTSGKGYDAFNRSWTEFQKGFGSVNDDFWIANILEHRDGWLFSAKDKELTNLKCATQQGAGWWYSTISNDKLCTKNGNVNILKWKTYYDKTRMLIKPT